MGQNLKDSGKRTAREQNEIHCTVPLGCSSLLLSCKVLLLHCEGATCWTGEKEGSLSSAAGDQGVQGV